MSEYTHETICNMYILHIFGCNCSDYFYFVTQRISVLLCYSRKKKSELVLNSCSHVFGMKLKAKCCAIK